MNKYAFVDGASLRGLIDDARKYFEISYKYIGSLKPKPTTKKKS